MLPKTEWMVLTRSVLTDVEQQNAWLQTARESGAVALIDKEEDWTSFDCVAKLRNRTRVKKVGHAGTLDPLATGLLIVCFGKATKDVEEFQEADKEYVVTVKLGATTATDDRGSEESQGDEVTGLQGGVETEQQGDTGHLTSSPSKSLQVPSIEIVSSLMEFEGTQHQIPPAYSAIKHAGRKQYDLARKGKAFVSRPRVVTINSITDVKVEWPMVDFTMSCTKGTYVRSVARDLGNKLGCGGYVWSLRRTRSGNFNVNDAVRVSEVLEMFAERTAA